MNHITNCDRCDSKIMNVHHKDKYIYRVVYYHRGESRAHTSDDYLLCTACQNDVYEYVTGESPDRSDMMDPESYDAIVSSVKSHIEQLEERLDAFTKAVNTDGE